MPDDILHGQHQHLGVHGLDGQRLVRHQGLGVPQGVHETGIANVDQNRMFGDRQDVESRLDDKTQRAFRTAEYAVEVETPVFLAQVRQIVASQAAVQRWKDILDQLGLRIGNLLRAAINVTCAVDTCLFAGQLLGSQCMAVDVRTAQQHRGQFKDVVTGLAVGATALPAGIGVDHAANRGAVGCRQFRCEKQPVRLERGIELVLDHTGLHAHPTFLDVDLENSVHVPRQVDHHTVGQRLSVGPGAAATRGQHHLLVLGPRRQTGDDCDVMAVHREHGSLWQALVDGVVSGQHCARTEVTGYFATKAGLRQGIEETVIVTDLLGGRFQQRNHGGLPR
ncbi:hypothetical protein ALP78_01189 [Pseudomonas coronafaciens pv. striafaciens]|uniref:Uncharacterized protein n=1 Tax=Pseudomonas coronafaciens pv. striafaciens TaxID=235276 RepID=A0A3M4YVA9_9PSED|nr:hypothetical protein ALP78_01189 [Pseudomonas coronafaciens pv. striafaciens]